MRCNRIDPNEKSCALYERGPHEQINLSSQIENGRAIATLQDNVVNVLKYGRILSARDDTRELETLPGVAHHLCPTVCHPVRLCSRRPGINDKIVCRQSNFTAKPKDP